MQTSDVASRDSSESPYGRRDDARGPFAVRYLEQRYLEYDASYAGSSLEGDVARARETYDQLSAALRDLVEAIEFTPLGLRALKALVPARRALVRVDAEKTGRDI